MLQLSFINIVYRKFVKNNKRRGGEGRGGEEGLKREGGLFERGRGGRLNRGFTVRVAQGKWILFT